MMTTWPRVSSKKRSTSAIYSRPRWPSQGRRPRRPNWPADGDDGADICDFHENLPPALLGVMISALGISRVFEVVGAFLGCEGSEEFTDCCANGFDCSRGALT